MQPGWTSSGISLQPKEEDNDFSQDHRFKTTPTPDFIDPIADGRKTLMVLLRKTLRCGRFSRLVDNTRFNREYCTGGQEEGKHDIQTRKQEGL